jgi:hypothetical protein
VQPPFHVTGAPIIDWVIFIVGVLVCLYLLRAFRPSSENAQLRLRNLASAVLGFVACQSVLVMMQVPSNSAVVLSVFVALIAFGPRKPLNRSFIARNLGYDDYDSPKYHFVASKNAPRAIMNTKKPATRTIKLRKV